MPAIGGRYIDIFFGDKENRMKQFTIVLDGVADRPQEKLNGKTPLEAAKTPGLDALFAAATPGTVRTIKPGLEVGSAVANLSLMGYDPEKTYKGRAVIEAAGANIPVTRGNLYIRCNFVTLKGDVYETSTLESYNAHDVETKDAAPLTERLNKEVFHPPFKLYHADTFRNILVVEGAGDLAEQLKFMPAHDMIGGAVQDFTQGSEIMQQYFALMKKAYGVLQADNPTKANGIWFWGASSAPDFGTPPTERRVVLSETSLMRGIAALAGLDCVTLLEDAGFEAFLKEKTKAALKAVSEYDYAYIHIQKPDDLSHELKPVEKMEAVELIEEHFIRPFFAQVNEPALSSCPTTIRFPTAAATAETRLRLCCWGTAAQARRGASPSRTAATRSWC
jgi:2,3-bisphosphoglycerate-independent phosphoglycerate mutase